MGKPETTPDCEHPGLDPRAISWILRRHASSIAMMGAAVLFSAVRRDPWLLLFAVGFAIRPVVSLVMNSRASAGTKRVVKKASGPLRVAFVAFCIVMLVRELSRIGIGSEAP